MKNSLASLLTAGILLLSSSLVAQAAPTKVIAESSEQAAPLLNGQMLPEVNTTTITGESVPLKKVLNGQKTVMFFYRGGWCPFCNTQMGQLKQLEPKLTEMGFKLVGISTDAPADLQKSIDKMDLSYTLLSDYNSKVSQAFGLAFFASQKTTERYLDMLKLTNPLQKNANGEERLVLPVPAIYIFDSNGLVQFNYVNPNFKVRLHQDVLLAAAKLVK